LDVDVELDASSDAVVQILRIANVQGAVPIETVVVAASGVIVTQRCVAAKAYAGVSISNCGASKGYQGSCCKKYPLRDAGVFFTA
jgi:hypothetical protein